MYSEKVKELLIALPNRGPLEPCTYTGRAQNQGCGDEIQIQLLIEGSLVRDCRFQASGCPGALAAAAGLTELLLEKDLAYCHSLGPEQLLEYLGGLPSHKEHGIGLAVEALKRAIQPFAGPA